MKTEPAGRILTNDASYILWQVEDCNKLVNISAFIGLIPTFQFDFVIWSLR